MKKKVLAPDESTEIHEVINEFIFHCQYEKNLSPKTITAYKIDLKQFESYLASVEYMDNIDNVSKSMIKHYLQHLADFKPKTIKRKIAALKALFKHYEFEHDNFINPFRKMNIQIKEPFLLPTVMNTNEIKMILTQLYKERITNRYTDNYTYKAQTRNIAIIELLFATGMRVSELCDLKCNDIDFSQGTIKIFGKGSKERIIQICSKDVLNILRSYYHLFHPDTYFFINRLGNQISTQSVRLLVKKCAKSVNLTKHITPHTFRHTFATLLLEEDVDIKYIQNLLGHSSILTTQIYTHVNSNKLMQILSTKHPRKKINITNLKLPI